MSGELETRWGIFGPVHVCCGVTAWVGHDIYCDNHPQNNPTATRDPHTGSTIYDGDPTVLWLAICHDGCGAHEFDCPEERDAWIGGHGEVHDVSKALEVRE